MPLEVDKPYLVLRTGMKDGKLVALVMDGHCDDGLTTGKPHLSLRTGMKDGKQVQLVADQRLDVDGKLVIDKPYLALRTGMKDGKLVVLVQGKQCEPASFTYCEGCEICCTLDATVEIGDGTSWLTGVDVALTCGGQVPFTTCYICTDDETPEENPILVNYENYWRGKTTLDVPFDEGVAGSGTYDFYSEIWSSPTFEIDEETYQLHFFAARVDRHRVLPTPSESTACSYGAVLKKQSLVIGSSEAWQTVIGSGPDTMVVMGFGGTDLFELELNPTYDPDPCPPGYSEAGGDCVDEEVCSIEPPGYTASGSGSSALCDAEDGTYVIQEKVFIGGGPELKCARFSIFDNCEPA